MDELGILQPRCPHCGTVMRDDPMGFRCGNCEHVDDHSKEMESVEIPPEFDGPDIHVR
jgi:tRNA(Ile2) C34 agmatinyltransferase TiaS